MLSELQSAIKIIHLITLAAVRKVGMGTETRYLIGLGAKL